MSKSSPVIDGIGQSQPSLRAQLFRGGIAALLVRIGAVMASLLASVTLARSLGPESYGVYVFVFSVITIIGLPVKMGIPVLVLRETARADQSGDGALMRGVWRWSDQTMALIALIVLVPCWICLWFVLDLETQRSAALLWALPLVPVLGWAEARGAATRALRHVLLGNGPDKVVRPLLLTGGVILAAVSLAAPLTAAQVYIIHLGSAAVTLLIAAIVLNRVRPCHPGMDSPRATPREWITAVLPLAGIAGLQLVSYNTDILMLGSLASDTEVGIYRVAVSGANLALFGVTTASLFLQPYIARAYGAKDHRQLQKFATLGARLSFAATLPILAFFWVGEKQLLTVVFGESYAGAFSALIILCLGKIVSGFFGSVGNILLMSGREWIALSGLAVSTVVNVVLNWILIPLYGIEGAAIATGASIAILAVGLWGATLIMLRIDGSPFGLKLKPRELSKS